MINLSYRIGAFRKTTKETNENVSITEEKDGPRRIVMVTALTDIVLEGASRKGKKTFDRNNLVMVNGYQSWTETRQFAYGEHLNDLSRRPKFAVNAYHFKNYGSQVFLPMNRDENTGFDYAYLVGKNPVFIGSLNYRNAYLIIKFNRSKNQLLLESDIYGKELKAGESFTVFDYVICGEADEYFGKFHPRTEEKICGFTSWYSFYQDINVEKLMKALDGLDERFELFQIDDGFEPFVGDWLEPDKSKFPSGLKPVVERIHESGRKAGIWLAPFVAEKKSKLAKEHPEWIAKDDKDGKIFSGSNWSGHYPLDLNDPDVVSYIRKCLRHYVELGFDFFKLDFLYAVNLKPLKGKTRSETAEFAYSILREELEGKLILGCGATLSNAFERFEYCRIGPDVSLDFDDKRYMRMFHPERISTKVTIQNTIFRKDMDGHVFLNDPDVFILRDDKVKLKKEQKLALMRMNALFGSVMMTSDIVSEYDGEKKCLLDEAFDLFRNAKVIKAERDEDIINVVFEFCGRTLSFDYNYEKGEIINWPLPERKAASGNDKRGCVT